MKEREEKEKKPLFGERRMYCTQIEFSPSLK